MFLPLRVSENTSLNSLSKQSLSASQVPLSFACREVAFAAVAFAELVVAGFRVTLLGTVSYTHLTLPTTPYV